jgi:hypothetical protein
LLFRSDEENEGREEGEESSLETFLIASSSSRPTIFKE